MEWHRNQGVDFCIAMLDKFEYIDYFVNGYLGLARHLEHIITESQYALKRSAFEYLINKIFESFPEYKNAYLEVGINNIRAIGLYSKFGFKKISKRKSYYPDGEDAIVMIKYAFE